MNIPRFLIDCQFIDESQSSITLKDAKLIKQIRKVLRLEKGSPLDILDGKGNIYHCHLQIGQGESALIAKIQSKKKLRVESETNFTVVLPLIKPARFEWALEKLTEIGADIIVPVTLTRTMIKLPPSTIGEDRTKFIRWQKIIQEATEQCERSVQPQLLQPLTFEHYLRTLPNNPGSLRIICTERKKVQSLQDLLYNHKQCPSFCAIALGAEGGFTEEEVKLALSYNFMPVSLGNNILRTETAAIYTLAIVKTFLANTKGAPIDR